MGQLTHDNLPVLCRIAYVGNIWSNDCGKPVFDLFDNVSGAGDAESRLRNIGKPGLIPGVQTAGIIDGGNERRWAVNSTKCAFNFRMTLMADLNDLIPLPRIAFGLNVEFGHQRTSRINDLQAPSANIFFEPSRNPVRAECRG